MTHTPYGYKIENAIAVIDEPIAEKIRELFQEYLDSGSKQLFGLLGGGIRISGEYVPVELEKVNAAIESKKNSWKE